MRDTVRTISEKTLRELTTRAHRLATTIETATKGASNSVVRREGARFGEVIEEWLEDIKGLIESHDATAADRVESFETRLRMAERKVDHWNLPPLPAAPAPRRKPAKANAVPEPEPDIEETSPWYVDDMDEIPVSLGAPEGDASKGKRSGASGGGGKKSRAA